MSQGAALVSTATHVETPFIIVKIGNYMFGHCGKSDRSRLSTTFNLTYPNYIESLTVTKVNGAINTYTLTMNYAITHTDDPNKLEKVFSSISDSRKLVLQYGDWSSPTFIFKEEEALIKTLRTRVNVASSTIQYVINCTSVSLSLTAGTFSFPARREKPSTVLFELLNNKQYGLTDIFKGMSNVVSSGLSNFIAVDDQTVDLAAKPSCGIFDYISYLVSCMVYSGDSSTGMKSSCYFWSVYDDISNKYGGTYFKVVRVAANTNSLVSYNTYEVDVGYPTSANVVDFQINNDDSWAILYNYAKEVKFPENAYKIDDDGNVVPQSSELVTASKLTYTTNEATRNWWSLMTQFPITATLTIKGLLRPAMLMSYVKVNTYFYGHKHTSSGLYIITKQQDTINQSGYRTTLTLTRVGGDEHYV